MMEQCLFSVSETKQNVRKANHILSSSSLHPLSLFLSILLSLLCTCCLYSGATGHINQREWQSDLINLL